LRSTFGEVNRLSTCVGGFDPRTQYQLYRRVHLGVIPDCLSGRGGFDSRLRGQQ